MDKKVAGFVKDVMGKGERMAPVRKISLKVKFDTKAAKTKALRKKMKY